MKREDSEKPKKIENKKLSSTLGTASKA